MVTRNQAYPEGAGQKMTRIAAQTPGIQRYANTKRPTYWQDFTQTNLPLQRMKIENSPRERTPRRDGRLRTRSPQPAPKEKEEAAGVHSGSEEGEIEED